MLSNLLDVAMPTPKLPLLAFMDGFLVVLLLAIGVITLFSLIVVFSVLLHKKKKKEKKQEQTKEKGESDP